MDFSIRESFLFRGCFSTSTQNGNIWESVNSVAIPIIVGAMFALFFSLKAGVYACFVVFVFMSFDSRKVEQVLPEAVEEKTPLPSRDDLEEQYQTACELYRESLVEIDKSNREVEEATKEVLDHNEKFKTAVLLVKMQTTRLESYKPPLNISPFSLDQSSTLKQKLEEAKKVVSEASEMLKEAQVRCKALVSKKSELVTRSQDLYNRYNELVDIRKVREKIS